MRFKQYSLILLLTLAVLGLKAAGGSPKQMPDHDDPRERAEAMERWYGGKPSRAYLRFKAQQAEKEVRKWEARIPGTKAFKGRRTLAAAMTTPVWQNLGPFAGRHFSENPAASDPDIDSGRVTVILPHPTNPKRLYVGFGGGGLWRCDNADPASTSDWVWTCLTDGIPVGSERGDVSVGGVAFKPEDPNTLYLVIGDSYRTGYSDSGSGGGLFISHDGGDTWERDASIDSSVPGSNLIVLPNNVVLFAGQGNLLRSVDGVSFNYVIRGGRTISLSSLVRLSNGTLVLADGSSFYYSLDQGATWIGSTVDASVTSLGLLGRTTLASSASNPSIVWALAEAGAVGSTTGILKSMDGGRSWTYVVDPSNVLFQSWIDGIMNDGGQAWYDEMIAVDPNDANTVFAAASIAVYRTTDGGNSWTALTDFMGHGRVYAHPDFHASAWSQAPGAPKTLYLGNDGGLSIVRDPNRVAIPMGSGGVAPDVSFVDNRRNKGLATHLSYSLGSTNASYPEDSRYRVSLGLQDNGTRIRSGILATSGTFDYISGGDASSTLIHPLNGNLILLSERSTVIAKSIDGGTTISDEYSFNPQPADGFNYIIPLIQGQADATGNTVYTCGTLNIFKSMDFGSTWTTMPGNGIDAQGHAGFRTLGAAKSNANALAALMYDGTGFITYNGGGTWTSMSLPSVATFSGSYVWFDSTNAQVLYLASVAYDWYSSHLWKSSDGGHSWKALDQNPDGSDNGFPYGIPVHVVQNDLSNPQALYAGTDFGVYQSLDGGLTWVRFGSGFPMVSAQDLWIAPDGSFMRVATFGRGVWEYQMKSPRISMSPAAATMQVGATRPFGAAFSGLITTGVSWTATGGSLSATTGGTVNYTAPTTVGTYSLTATSQADPTLAATATITVTPKIVVSPMAASIEINGTQAITATVLGTTNTGVTWTVTGGALSATTGSTVTFTAPATAGTYTVTATSQADTTKKATTTVTVTPRITVSPASATLEIGSTQAITATVTGSTNTTVTWTTSGGTLSSTTGNSVTYTAPVTGGTYTVTATSQANTTKKATATFTATPVVVLTPSSATLEINGTLSLTATVNILANTAVTWSATGGSFSATSGGTVTYTAPPTAGTYVVTATSQADTSKKATATIKVTPKIEVSPANVTMEIDSSLAITATVTGTTNTGVSWVATGGTLSASTGGTVTFTAPQVVGSYTITATSQADATKHASATISTVPYNLSESEANDSIGTADVAPLGIGTLSGTVSSMSDYDYFAIRVRAGATLSVSTMDDVGMALQDAAGGSIGSCVGGGSLSYANTSSGTVTVYLRMGGYYRSEVDPNTGKTYRFPHFGTYSVSVRL